MDVEQEAIPEVEKEQMFWFPFPCPVASGRVVVLLDVL